MKGIKSPQDEQNVHRLGTSAPDKTKKVLPALDTHTPLTSQRFGGCTPFQCKTELEFGDSGPGWVETTICP